MEKLYFQTVNRFLDKLNADELEILSKFIIDIAKGIIGVPIVVYFVSDFSIIVLTQIFMIDLITVTSFLSVAFKLRRLAKRRKSYG